MRRFKVIVGLFLFLAGLWAGAYFFDKVDEWDSEWMKIPIAGTAAFSCGFGLLTFLIKIAD